MNWRKKSNFEKKKHYIEQRYIESLLYYNICEAKYSLKYSLFILMDLFHIYLFQLVFIVSYRYTHHYGNLNYLVLH